ncbi:hypothetical protein FBU59_003124 [Linderina macrospora]|uniref:Uncharacterized protein n=1 Tax=Linderina macrospora TaxID=4868 RepID=A0ACC1J9J4_9FUNG|nr:hypothetical protein FBU59_003124 [Linderina macrospora]
MRASIFAAIFATAFAIELTPPIDPKITVSCSQQEWQPRLAGRRIVEERREGWHGEFSNVYFVQDLPFFHRIVRPGDMITSDFRPDRLTVRIDNKGSVVEVKCN